MPLAFVALSATVLVEVAVGVPDMRPVAVFTVSGDGNPEALKLVGLFVAVI